MYLEIQNISKTFDTDQGYIKVLENISFSVNRSEFICILGPNGCGKTTLLRIIAGLESNTSGEIILNNNIVNKGNTYCGMVFQHYALFPWRTIIRNIAFGPELKNITKQEIYEIANRYIKLVELQGFENFYPHEISEGMKQKAAIARALANDPLVLLMDEPFSALDIRTKKKMQEELLGIWKKTNQTILFITHSIEEALFLADKIVILSARPSKILKIIQVNIPRPHKRTEIRFLKMRETIDELLLCEEIK